MSDDHYTDDEDLIEIGQKVVEMAERVETMDRIMPGCKASWVFEMDGMPYRVSIGVDRGATNG
ncbi:hypothetical protein [Celeribacter sp.]|uniref:hypothetical protein n=1 Tax=Celeribacter sp. TaxID=1890673 RepID=UPI003A93A714